MVRPSKPGQKLSAPTSSTPERQRANLDLFMECVDEDLAPSQQVANQIATTEYKTVQKHIETVNWVPAAAQRPVPKNVVVASRSQPSVVKTVPAPKAATGQSKTTSAMARTGVPSSKTLSHQKNAPPLKTAPAATKVSVQKHSASKTAAAGSRSTAPLVLTLPKSAPSSQAKIVRNAKALKRPASPPDVIILDDDEPDVVVTKATVGRSSTSGGLRATKQTSRQSAVHAPVTTSGVIPLQAQKMYFAMPPGAVGPPVIVPQNFSQFHFLSPMAAGIGVNTFGVQLSQGHFGMPPCPTQHLQHQQQQIHTSQKGYSGNYYPLQETENRHSSSPEFEDHASDSDYCPHGSTVGSATKRRGRKRHSRGRGRPASSVMPMGMYQSYNDQTGRKSLTNSPTLSYSISQNNFSEQQQQDEYRRLCSSSGAVLEETSAQHHPQQQPAIYSMVWNGNMWMPMAIATEAPAQPFVEEMPCCKSTKQFRKDLPASQQPIPKPTLVYDTSSIDPSGQPYIVNVWSEQQSEGVPLPKPEAQPTPVEMHTRSGRLKKAKTELVKAKQFKEEAFNDDLCADNYNLHHCEFPAVSNVAGTRKRPQLAVVNPLIAEVAHHNKGVLDVSLEHKPVNSRDNLACSTLNQIHSSNDADLTEPFQTRSGLKWLNTQLQEKNPAKPVTKSLQMPVGKHGAKSGKSKPHVSAYEPRSKSSLMTRCMAHTTNRTLAAPEKTAMCSAKPEQAIQHQLVTVTVAPKQRANPLVLKLKRRFDHFAVEPMHSPQKVETAIVPSSGTIAKPRDMFSSIANKHPKLGAGIKISEAAKLLDKEAVVRVVRHNIDLHASSLSGTVSSIITRKSQLVSSNKASTLSQKMAAVTSVRLKHSKLKPSLPLKQQARTTSNLLVPTSLAVSGKLPPPSVIPTPILHDQQVVRANRFGKVKTSNSLAVLAMVAKKAKTSASQAVERLLDKKKRVVSQPSAKLTGAGRKRPLSKTPPKTTSAAESRVWKLKKRAHLTVAQHGKPTPVWTKLKTVHGSRQKTITSASVKSAQTAGTKRAVVGKTPIPKKIAKLSSVDNVLEAVARGSGQIGSKTSSSGRPIIKKKLADYAVKSPVKKKRGRPSNASRLSAANESVTTVDEAVDDDRSSWVPLAEYYYGRKEGDPSYREEKGEFKFKCWYCHVMLNNNIRMMSHIQGHIDPEKQHNFDNNNITQCKHCRQRFATPFEIQCHIEKVHKNKAKALMCLICEKDTDTQVSLRRHMSQLHKACEMPYNCQLCGFRSSVYEDVIDHFKKRHDSSPHLLCLYCLKLFNLRGQFEKQANWGVTHVYYYHLQKHVINKVNQKKCPNCKLIFLSKQEVTQHIIKDHAPNFRGILGNEHSLLNGRASSKLQADDTVMIPLPHPNVKLLNAPTAHSHIDLSDVKFFNVEDKHNCLECGQSMNKPGHYKDYVACTMCRFATVCSDAYLNHMGLVHCAKVPHVVVDGILTNVTKRRNTRLADETYCLCGFSSTYGSVIAKHLVSCSKRTCYETPQEQRYFEYDDEDEEYNPFEPYIDDVNDFEGSDSQSPDRDIPSLFGALGLVKQPHRKFRVSRIPIPELTPEEIAVSVIDELLDGIFPAEAAASEFWTALMNSVDAVIVAKETKVKAVNDALVALLNHVDRVVTAKEKVKEKAVRDVINTLLDNVDKTIRHKEKTISEALTTILDNVDRIVGMKEKAIQDALDLLLCNVDSIIKAKEKKQKDINDALMRLLDNADKTIQANEAKAARQLSEKTRVSLGSHQSNDEWFEDLKGSRKWSTVELSNATMSSKSPDFIGWEENMDFCSNMNKMEDEECNSESSDGMMLTNDNNEKQVGGHVENLSGNMANATDEVDIKIESEMEPQKVDVFVTAKPALPEFHDLGCTNNSGVVEKHEVSQSVSSIDNSCRTDSYGAFDVFSQHGHRDLFSGHDGNTLGSIDSNTCEVNSNFLEKQTSISCGLVTDQVDLMDEFDSYEITGEKVSSEAVRTECAKTEVLAEVGSQIQNMELAEESFINIDGIVSSSDAFKTSDPEVRLSVKVDVDSEYGIHSLPMIASDCQALNSESLSHNTVAALVSSEADKSDKLAPAADSTDPLNAEVPVISKLHSSASAELNCGIDGRFEGDSYLGMQSCSGTEAASSSCENQSNNDTVEKLCQYGKFDACDDGDENSGRTVELVVRGVDGVLPFEKSQFSVHHLAVPVSQGCLQNSESVSCREVSVDEPSNEAASQTEASGDKNADKKTLSNQLHTVVGQVAPSSSQQFRQQASSHPNKRPFDSRPALSSSSDDYRHGNHRRDDHRHVEHRDGWRGGYDRRGGGFGDQRDYRRDYNWQGQGHGNWQNANYSRHGGGGQEQWGYSHDGQRRDNYHDHRQGYQYGDRRRGGYHGGGSGYNDRR